jgi:hypothetical protein
VSVTVTFCGTQYTLPSLNDTNAWGTSLTAYFQALAAPTYFLSPTANPASAGLLRLAKTDQVKFRNNANSADVALGMGSADQLQWGGVDVTGNPQAIYGAPSGTVTSGATTIINFSTLELDTANAVTTGASWKFTVPTGKGGLYEISAAVTPNGAIASGVTQLLLYKNGSAVRTLWRSSGAVPSTTMIRGQTTINLAAGDYVDVRLTQSSGGSVSITSTNVQENYISIHRQVS